MIYYDWFSMHQGILRNLRLAMLDTIAGMVLVRKWHHCSHPCSAWSVIPEVPDEMHSVLRYGALDGPWHPLERSSMLTGWLDHAGGIHWIWGSFFRPWEEWCPSSTHVTGKSNLACGKTPKISHRWDLKVWPCPFSPPSGAKGRHLGMLGCFEPLVSGDTLGLI